MKIDDLRIEETKRYLLHMWDYKLLKGNKEERGKVVEELSPFAGNGLLYLNVLSHKVPR